MVMLCYALLVFTKIPHLIKCNAYEYGGRKDAQLNTRCVQCSVTYGKAVEKVDISRKKEEMDCDTTFT